MAECVQLYWLKMSNCQVPSLFFRRKAAGKPEFPTGRLFQWTARFLAVCLAAVWVAGCASPRRPRHLVLIVSDALRRDVLGCYGGSAYTPNIDRLVREGTVFDNAYSTAPTTMPSAVSMLTGCYARTFTFDHRMVYLDYLDKRVPSAFFRVGDGVRMLAEVLKDRGVDTRVSMENGLVRVCNLLQGFDRLPGCKGLTPAAREAVETRLDFHAEDSAFAALFGPLDFLLNADPRKPFFLFTWIFDPHAPYNPAPRFRAAVDAAAGHLPRPGDFYSNPKDAELRWRLDNNRLTIPEKDYLTALYRAEVEAVDFRVGALLRALDAQGLRKHTLVVFTADHGECLGDYDMYGHGRAVHPPLVRVPLVFSGPGIPRGMRVPTVVSHLDLTPTLVEMFSVTGTSFMQGCSYAAAFRRKTLQDRDVYFDYFSNVLEEWLEVDGLLSGGFQLVVDRRGEAIRFTLHHLVSDPAAGRDVAADHPDVVRRLFARLQGFRRRNRPLLLEHAGKVRGNLDPAAEREKARLLLESLGYL